MAFTVLALLNNREKRELPYSPAVTRARESRTDVWGCILVSTQTARACHRNAIYLAPEYDQHNRLYIQLVDTVTAHMPCRVEQGQLAKWLVDNSCADRVFFCNSGAEAVEASIKVPLFSPISKKINDLPLLCLQYSVDTGRRRWFLTRAV